MKIFDKFPLARPGWSCLFITTILTGLANIIHPGYTTVVFLIIIIWIVWFFRDPARFSQASPQTIISPADGKIIALTKVDYPEIYDDRALMVSIFMNIMDVHVNRIPSAGKVLNISYFSGDFLPANYSQAREVNERCILLLKTVTNKCIVVTQVAGLIARCIECWTFPEKKLQRGERYGIIYFGSRVDIYLPSLAKIKVTLGQKVKAGQTEIADLN